MIVFVNRFHECYHESDGLSHGTRHPYLLGVMLSEAFNFVGASPIRQGIRYTTSKVSVSMHYLYSYCREPENTVPLPRADSSSNS